MEAVGDVFDVDAVDSVVKVAVAVLLALAVEIEVETSVANSACRNFTVSPSDAFGLLRHPDSNVSMTAASISTALPTIMLFAQREPTHNSLRTPIQSSPANSSRSLLRMYPMRHRPYRNTRTAGSSHPGTTAS